MSISQNKHDNRLKISRFKAKQNRLLKHFISYGINITDNSLWCLSYFRDIAFRFLKAKVFYQLCPFHWLLTFKACFHISCTVLRISKLIGITFLKHCSIFVTVFILFVGVHACSGQRQLKSFLVPSCGSWQLTSLRLSHNLVGGD